MVEIITNNIYRNNTKQQCLFILSEFKDNIINKIDWIFSNNWVIITKKVLI